MGIVTETFLLGDLHHSLVVLPTQLHNSLVTSQWLEKCDGRPTLPYTIPSRSPATSKPPMPYTILTIVPFDALQALFRSVHAQRGRRLYPAQ